MSGGLNIKNDVNDLDFYLNVSKGWVDGYDPWYILGERDNAGVTAAGEDVWQGTDVIIPFPSSSGETVSIVSTSANDTSDGTGARQVVIHGLDVGGSEQSETVILSGTTPVVSTLSYIFINKFYVTTVGSNNISVGDITIYKTGVATTVYSIIKANGNAALSCLYKVPVNKTLYILSWAVSASNNKRVTCRVRSTDENGALSSGVFTFKMIASLQDSTIQVRRPVAMLVPPLSVLKVTAYPSAAAAYIASQIDGILINN